jgi:hypothetical protein
MRCPPKGGGHFVLHGLQEIRRWPWRDLDPDGRYMAEGEGFEPPVPFQVRRSSRPMPSTTRPALRFRKPVSPDLFTVRPPPRPRQRSPRTWQTLTSDSESQFRSLFPVPCPLSPARTPVTAVTSRPPTPCYCTFAPGEIPEFSFQKRARVPPVFFIFLFFSRFPQLF